MPKLYNCTEVAAAAGMSAATLCRRMQMGCGPRAQRLGRDFFVTEADLNDWLATSGAQLRRSGP